MKAILSFTALVSICAILVHGQAESIPPTGDNVCRTKECYAVSANILKAINPNVNPCEDFYEYSCKSIFNAGKIFTSGK